jgi:hypothetical protein
VPPPWTAARCTLEINPPLPAALKRESVVVHANVALASHGESVTQVMGSGNGAQAFQSFELKQVPLTYRAAPTETGRMAETQEEEMARQQAASQRQAAVRMAATQEEAMARSQADAQRLAAVRMAETQEERNGAPTSCLTKASCSQNGCNPRGSISAPSG